MSGKSTTRAEYVQKLCEMVTEGAKVEVFSPETPKNWPKTHNPAQDIPNNPEDVK